MRLYIKWYVALQIYLYNYKLFEFLFEYHSGLNIVQFISNILWKGHSVTAGMPHGEEYNLFRNEV